MKFIKLESTVSRTQLLDIIGNSELVNSKVKFDENKGKPLIKMKEKDGIIRIKCEMIGGPTRDNGFLEGTYFIGRLTEKNGVSSLCGIILTAPIYHTILALILAFYVYRCISLSAFNPVPIILLAFSIILFKSEFEKQGIIERYLIRAFKRADENNA